MDGSKRDEINLEISVLLNTTNKYVWWKVSKKLILSSNEAV